MYIGGYFYGAISVAQAYVEALAGYLAETNFVRKASKPGDMWARLRDEQVVTSSCADAARAILDNRNDFHHLNKDIETDRQSLEARAGRVIEHLHTIESEVFACALSATPGVVDLKQPRYWPSDTPGLAQVHLRSL
jgi:hypothetical protein